MVVVGRLKPAGVSVFREGQDRLAARNPVMLFGLSREEGFSPSSGGSFRQGPKMRRLPFVVIRAVSRRRWRERPKRFFMHPIASTSKYGTAAGQDHLGTPGRNLPA